MSARPHRLTRWAVSPVVVVALAVPVAGCGDTPGDAAARGSTARPSAGAPESSTGQRRHPVGPMHPARCRVLVQRRIPGTEMTTRYVVHLRRCIAQVHALGR